MTAEQLIHTEPDQAAVSTRNLTRRFDKVTAVDTINLKITAKSIYGLIGPNGAGKTTTLRMLAGLLEPTSGEIRINGLAVHQYWHELQWQIGYMPDSFGVYEDLLVWEYLDFFARCYQLPPKRREKVVGELLELVGLSEKREVYVETLSRGMRQRLCLAHALVNDPLVLLLDEPASGLDPRARVEMRELLRELRNMGKTIVVSSHILSELAELCDAVGILSRGKLIATGPLTEMRNHWNQSGWPADQRKFQLRTLAGIDQAEAVLRNSSGVEQIYPAETGNSLRFEFSQDDLAVVALLEKLVSEKVGLISFTEEVTDLEEVFLHLTSESEDNLEGEPQA